MRTSSAYTKPREWEMVHRGKTMSLNVLNADTYVPKYSRVDAARRQPVTEFSINVSSMDSDTFGGCCLDARDRAQHIRRL